jgi:hypothetical protein
MTSTTEIVKLALGALLTGIAIPLLVQLFLVLRNVRRATAVLDQRLDRTLRDMGDVIAELKRASTPSPSLSSQLVAALPAIVAAMRAFRNGVAHEGAVHSTDNHHAKEAP